MYSSSSSSLKQMQRNVMTRMLHAICIEAESGMKWIELTLIRMARWFNRGSILIARPVAIEITRVSMRRGVFLPVESDRRRPRMVKFIGDTFSSILWCRAIDWTTFRLMYIGELFQFRKINQFYWTKADIRFLCIYCIPLSFVLGEWTTYYVWRRGTRGKRWNFSLTSITTRENRCGFCESDTQIRHFQ